MEVRALDVCAGSGIGSAVWRALGGRTVCYVEKDAYCQRLLQVRMRDGLIDDGPLWSDLLDFDGRPWRGLVDFMFGGIPCQPWSVAGKGRGEADERDLWPAFRRVLREVGPTFALIENVSGILIRGLPRILGELAEDGYDAEWAVLAAQDVGAPHRRERVWIIAYPEGYLWRASGDDRSQSSDGCGSPLADARREGCERRGLRGWQAQVEEVFDNGSADSDAAVAHAGNQGPPCPGRRDEHEGEIGFTGDGDGEVSEPDVGQLHRGLPQADERAVPRGDGTAAADADCQPPRRSAVTREECGERATFGGLGRTIDGLALWMDEPGAFAWADGWEDGIPRVASGVPDRANRLRILGNGWVPQVAIIPLERVARLLREA